MSTPFLVCSATGYYYPLKARLHQCLKSKLLIRAVSRRCTLLFFRPSSSHSSLQSYYKRLAYQRRAQPCRGFFAATVSPSSSLHSSRLVCWTFATRMGSYLRVWRQDIRRDGERRKGNRDTFLLANTSALDIINFSNFVSLPHSCLVV